MGLRSPRAARPTSVFDGPPPARYIHPMFTPQFIAKRVREERLVRLWSQQDLAEKAYLHLNTIYRVENARAIPSLLTQQRLATAFGIKRTDLFGD